MLNLGMVCCDVDHGVFFGEWSSPPDISVAMPSDSGPLVLYVSIHVDNGLAVTNSPSLYSGSWLHYDGISSLSISGTVLNF